ncbi:MULTISPECIES: amino acid ABC transporter permease [Arthrobacter]|uniref:Amino acid ABC transporter permease n=1 Tax=Arthrobacter psychrochitiniphilus TaxID=291045 RepID=A0A2V3DTR7_9MICC|nr:amino acid ABC transporter permease [Arthrobacter psychrochitiniphilus]NYG15788.1 His/Glu/Gln/Arg/opine family amino acid ABC transporter permease subunit [Arthrobacter psychrochitiniphilus]PXA66760.1 amino acid ABC transporter permease [Arthrobacter psychrochitiniphilus]
MLFDSNIFFAQLVSVDYMRGAALSVAVAIVSLILATVIGFFMAVGRTAKQPYLRAPAHFYVWFFRAIPALLVLLIMWNALPQIIPALRADWFSPFIAASVGLGLVEAAFMSEIIRSALLSVDDGQGLAGRALGMSPAKVMVKVVLPQAIRIALPPTGNEFIGLVKYSSLASVISLRELLTTAQVGVNITFRYAEYYAAAIVYYLVIVSILSILQGLLEKKFAWTSKSAKSKKSTEATVPAPMGIS